MCHVYIQYICFRATGKLSLILNTIFFPPKKLSDVDKTYIDIGNGQKFELYVCIMSCMNEHYPTLSTHETLQQMPSIKKNEWQRRRFFTFCSLIDVFWPLPHTVEKNVFAFFLALFYITIV